MPNTVHLNSDNAEGGMLHRTDGPHTLGHNAETGDAPATTENPIDSEHQGADTSDMPRLPVGTAYVPPTGRDNTDTINMPRINNNTADGSPMINADVPTMQHEHQPTYIADAPTGRAETTFRQDPDPEYQTIITPNTPANIGFPLDNYFGNPNRPVQQGPVQNLQWDDPNLYTLTPTPERDSWVGDFPTDAWLGDMTGGQYVPVADEWNMLVPAGQNPYAPGPEGIDYGVLLNVQGIGQSAGENIQPDLSSAQESGVPDRTSGYNAGPPSGIESLLTENGAQNALISDRRKRTADDLAATEAEIIPDNQKCRRFVKIRSS